MINVTAKFTTQFKTTTAKHQYFNNNKLMKHSHEQVILSYWLFLSCQPQMDVATIPSCLTATPQPVGTTFTL